MKPATAYFVRVLILTILVFQTLPLNAFASETPTTACVLPEAKAGDGYEFTIRTEGGQPPFKWIVIDGELPPGVELLPSGILRGTPAVSRSDSYEFTLQVSDSSVPPQAFAQRFRLGVRPGTLRMILGSKLSIVPPTQTSYPAALAPNGSTKAAAERSSGSAAFSLDTAIISGALKEGNETVRGFITPRAERVFIEVFGSASSGRDALTTRMPVKSIDINTGEFNEKLSPALKKDQRVRVIGLLIEGSRQVQLISDEVTVGPPDPPVKAPPPTVRKPILEGSRTLSGFALPDSKGGKPTKVRVEIYNGRETEPNLVGETDDIKKTGEYTVALSDALEVGQTIRTQAWVDKTEGETTPVENNPNLVEAIGDWGRARATFAFGAVFSKEREDFSKSDPYLDFNLDYNWARRQSDGRAFAYLFNTFFSTRLTTIPVDPDKQKQATNSVARFTKAADPAPEASTAKCDPSTSDGFLCSRKSVTLQVGAYFPLWTKRLTWDHGGSGNALFFAPIIKGGMNTLTADGEKGRNLLTFYSGGLRFGHLDTGKYTPALLSREAKDAPRLISYLDITLGKWQNIEYLGKRQLRTGFEGRIKIPALPLRLGFDANVGKGPDDLRFLIDTNLDVGKMFKKIMQPN